MTTTQWKPRQGGTKDMSSFKGVHGEVVLDNEKYVMVVCDGHLEGGYPQARQDLFNVELSTLLNKGLASDDLSNVEKDSIIDKGIASSDLSNITLEDADKVGLALKTGKNIVHSSTPTSGETEEEKDGYGVIRLATVDEAIAGQLNVCAITPYTLAQYLSRKTRFLPPMAIDGLTVSNSKINKDNGILISKGSCRDTTDSVDIISSIDKEYIISGEVLADTCYHIFVGISQANKVAFYHTTDLIPTKFIEQGYTRYRRIGSIILDENKVIKPYTLIDDYLYFDTPITISNEEYSELKLELPPKCLPIILADTEIKIGISELVFNTMKGLINCYKLNADCKIWIKTKTGKSIKIIGYVDLRK